MITIFAIRRRREVYEELLKNSREQVPAPDQLPRHGESGCQAKTQGVSWQRQSVRVTATRKCQGESSWS